MSFVSQVLSCAGQLEAKEIQGKMDLLGKKMEDLKLEIYEVTRGKYVDFFTQKLQATSALVENVEKVSGDLHDAKEKIENDVQNQLTLSKEVLTNLKGDLENHKCVLVILERLLQIQDNLECAASANKRHSYSEAAASLLKADVLLGTPLEGYDDIEVLMALQTECCVQKQKLIFEMTEKWKQMISWSSSDANSQSKSRQVFQLELTSGGNVLSEIIGAMETLGDLESTLKNFGKRLISDLFKPCVVNSTATVKNTPENIVIVTVNNEKTPVPPPPKQMYMNVMTIIQVLEKYFSDLTVQDGTNFLSCVGRQVSQELLELIVKECLTPAIPHNNKDMAEFEANCIEPTKAFQGILVNLKFIPEDDNALEEFVKNIDVLFVNKKSQDILLRARELMKSELHNTVKVSDEYPLGEMAGGPSERKSRKVELASSGQGSSDTFKLPACQISACTQQLMTLAYETLEEATSSSQECAVQLFFAARNMFELFCSVYPTAHQKALSLFPQMSAVFNNDCMYVCHHLAMIGHQFNKSLPEDVQATFVDLMPKIRRLGTDTMLQQLNSQKDIMLDYLQAAKGFVSVSEGSNSTSTEKAVKQVLHQLGHLQKVWQEILPVNQYRKSIGTLLNMVVVEICDRVVSLEDISASDASQLASLMSLIQKRAGPLMKSTNDEGDVNVTIELQRNVLKWLRFTEIITVLNASLLEINDRWADGKGPLAPLPWKMSGLAVHNLRTINDGGILDPDDQLNDVVDDREQLIADYEEQGGQTYQPHNGDGASQSSAGTASPDIFQGSGESSSPFPSTKTISVYQPSNEHDVVVTSKDIETHGSLLTVRHGSEPALNILDGDKPYKKDIKAVEEPSDSEDLEVEKEMAPSGDKGKAPISRFSRDTWRQSLGNRPDMYKWLEAQERQQERMEGPIHPMERREPVGGVSTEPGTDSRVDHHTHSGILIHLPNDGGPLGIHVVPDYDDSGKELGLLVQGVEEGGRVFKDGRLRENDRIIDINGQTLMGVTFSKAQDIFRSAMKDNNIRLRIIKKQAPPPLPKQPPPPIMPKPKNHTPAKPSPLTLPPPRLNESDLSSPTGPEQTSTPIVSVQNSSSSSIEGIIPSPIKPVIPAKPTSPTKKVPPAIPTRNPDTTLSTGNATKERNKLVAPTNTKKIGKKMEITLVKGPVSLGFSVTTRDNPAGGDSPIYIKNILPRGAAITDGRLKAGDRLLEVNGEDLTGKTQADVVSLLRNAPMGSSVRLVISRQEVIDEKFQVPRELRDDSVSETRPVLQPPEKTGDTDGLLTANRNKEILRLDIPLSESGSAGLGVSVKGKTMTTDRGTRDLGIFVKSVIHGGAASKDGRLAVNDQLIEVNSEKLMGLSNTDAMEMLRRAMQLDGPIPGHIHLVVARKIGAPSPSPFTQEASPDAFVFGANNRMVRETDHAKHSLMKDADMVESPRLDYMDGGSGKARNFLIDRLTNGGLRNESYTKATRDELDDSAMSHDQDDGFRNQSYNLALRGSGNILSPGTSPFKPMQKSTPFVDPNVMIENDDEEMESRQRMRPHSTIGFLHHNHSNSSSSEDLNQQPVWLQGGDWGPPGSPGGEELSPTSPLGEFKREGFGRQSMSEKRKGHIDPSRSEVYQRVKSSRQRGGAMGSLKRVGSAESLLSRNSRNCPRASRLPPLPVHGQRITDRRAVEPPQSNLKRFSSLENLAQMTPGDTDESRESLNASQESHDDSQRGGVKLGRGRGCNLSFRAAVDRSYDPVPQELSTMDPQVQNENQEGILESSGGFTVGEHVEEESSEGGSVTQAAINNSGHSSMSSEAEEAKKSKKKQTKEKKGPGGIFKGLLRRSNKNKRDETKAEETDRQAEPVEKGHDRIHEQVRQLQDQKSNAEFMKLEQKYSDGAPQFSLHSPQIQGSSIITEDHSQTSNNSSSRFTDHSSHYTESSSRLTDKNPSSYNDYQSQFAGHPQPSRSIVDPESMSRAEWIQHLRREHQRRHQEREGHYPLDDREERYEKEIQAEETMVGTPWQDARDLAWQNARHSANQRYGKSAIPENILYPHHPPSSVVPDDSYHGYQGNRTQSTGHSYPERPHSRPAYQEPSSFHHNYHYHDNIIHQRQRSNEYIPPRQQAIEHFQHHRQNSDLSEQHTQEFYSRRPPLQPRPYTPKEHWQNTESAPAMMKHYPHPQAPPGPGPQYGDPIFAYRDPIYPSMAGKRSVQSLSSQPNSAKV